MERWRVGPSADGENKLEVSVLLLQFVDCLEVSVQILPTVVPRIPRVVNFLIGPGIRQENLAGIRLYICKCIQNMPTFALAELTKNLTLGDSRQVVNRDQGRRKFASVYPPELLLGMFDRG